MRAYPLVFIFALVACGQPSGKQTTEPATVDSLSASDNGTYTETMPDGTRLQGGLRDGSRIGIWRSFGPDGKLRSQTEYKEGKPHGPSAVFHPNGSLYYTGDNRQGVPVGEWRFLDEQGGLLKVVVYDSTGHKIMER